MLPEKQALEQQAYPVLREHFRKLGVQFVITESDLEGGNPARCMDFHYSLMEECQQETLGPSLVVREC